MAIEFACFGLYANARPQLREFIRTHGPLHATVGVQHRRVSADEDGEVRRAEWVCREAWDVLGLLRLLGAIRLPAAIDRIHLPDWKVRAATIVNTRTMADLLPSKEQSESYKVGPDTRRVEVRRRLCAHIRKTINGYLTDISLVMAGTDLPFAFEQGERTVGTQIWLTLAGFASKSKTLVGACKACGALIVHGGALNEGYRRGLVVRGDGPTARALYCDNGGRCKQAAYRAKQKCKRGMYGRSSTKRGSDSVKTRKPKVGQR